MHIPNSLLAYGVTIARSADLRINLRQSHVGSACFRNLRPTKIESTQWHVIDHPESYLENCLSSLSGNQSICARYHELVYQRFYRTAAYRSYWSHRNCISSRDHHAYQDKERKKKTINDGNKSARRLEKQEVRKRLRKRIVRIHSSETWTKYREIFESAWIRPAFFASRNPRTCALIAQLLRACEIDL